jgi:hypothetical protein
MLGRTAEQAFKPEDAEARLAEFVVIWTPCPQCFAEEALGMTANFTALPAPAR